MRDVSPEPAASVDVPSDVPDPAEQAAVVARSTTLPAAVAKRLGFIVTPSRAAIEGHRS